MTDSRCDSGSCERVAAQPLAIPRPAVEPWIAGAVDTVVGKVPVVKTSLKARDYVGSMKVRWNVRRMDYRVPPGLYAVGDPSAESPVLVSANYKLSFDRLRGAVEGRSAWLLVLDTKGVNVWCAAGKGTFGTDELVARVNSCLLERLVSHRKLVVPQLGAPGVSAPEVHRRCGFRVEYGPVRASDLPAFLDAGMKATPDMRRVRFGLWDRLVVAPVELTIGAKKAALIAASLVLLGGLGPNGYSMEGVRAVGLPSAALVLVSFVLASVLGPALLPWIPGRAFALKGAVLGVVVFACLATCGAPLGAGWLPALAWGLSIPAISSFVVMNFTGASTFTSQSGVLREMRVAVPLQIAAAALGAACWLAGLFVAGSHP